MLYMRSFASIMAINCSFWKIKCQGKVPFKPTFSIFSKTKTIEIFWMSSNEEETKLSFVAEWFDPHRQIVKKYLLQYYENSHEVEMKEIESCRKFLKRSKIQGSISKSDFIVGNTVIIFSRDLKLVDYGDNDTRRLLESASEKAIIFLTPKSCPSVGKVISTAEAAGLTLVDLKGFNVDSNKILEAAAVLQIDPEELRGDEGRSMSFCVCLELRGEKAFMTLSGAFVELKKHVDIIVSTPEEKHTFQDKFLSKSQKPIVKYDAQGSTCCVIKPHAVKSRLVGNIIEDILDRGLNISAIQLLQVDRIRAAEFYEVYKGMKEFHGMVDELISGPILAMEISNTNVEKFREMHAGPWDSEMAKKLYKDTIRAKFGKNRIQNAIHCTDLKEDCTNELSYFFDILTSDE